MIPLVAPDIGPEEIQAVSDVLLSGQLFQGRRVEQFEQQVASYLAVDRVLAVSSGTAALHLACLTLGLGAQDEVLVPGFTLPATSNAVESTGATPVYVDIDPGTYNMRSDLIPALITPRTTALIAVHEFGCPASMRELTQLASQFRLKLIEDAACSLGARWDDRPVGTWGDVGCFSFHPRKAITTGDGGLIVANSPVLTERLALLRNHGMVRSNAAVDFVCGGLNYRKTEFQAALGSVQMRKLESLIDARRSLASRHFEDLADLGMVLPREPCGGRHGFQTYHVRLSDALNRDAVILDLASQGISANTGANALSLRSHHRRFARSSLPESEAAYRHGLALPLYGALDRASLAVVVRALKMMCSSESADHCGPGTL